jgi:hypothetical protein
VTYLPSSSEYPDRDNFLIISLNRGVACSFLQKWIVKQVAILLVIAMIALGACQTDQEEVRPAENKLISNLTDEKKGEEMTASPQYDFVISFISHGAGIDMATYDRFSTYLKSLGDKVTYERVRWGMEGEVDYCINLSEIIDVEREKIHSTFNQMLRDNQLVIIEMNAACSKRNWIKE